MASAYELMLVLRGRNYLSNDLRRAGSDLRRLQTQGGLQSQRSQLQVNARRLASTRAIAQAEKDSIATGTRRLALNKAIQANEVQQANALQAIRRAETEIDVIEKRRLESSARASMLQRRVQSGRPLRGFNMEETTKLRDAAVLQQGAVAEQAATQARQLEIARAAQAAGIITAQQLIEKEAELAHRQEILTERINTTTAAEELNSEKMRENALAMKRLPFERFAAGAQYVEHLGRTFQTFGLIATAALGAAAYAASKFETESTLAATQATIVGQRSVRAVQRNSREIQQSVQQMLNTGSTAVKPADLTQGLYSVYSGITLKGNQREQIQQGIDIIKQFSRVYTANFGQVEFNDVVKAGITLINNFGVSTKQLPGVLNRMQASVRFGALTMGEFVGSLNQVVPAFRGAHLGFDQMSADIAFVSRLFPSLRTGTTGLARLTEIFARKKTMEGIKEQLGIDVAPGGKLLPINQIVDQIIKARPELAKGGTDLQNFFKTVSGTEGNIQSRRVFIGYATNAKLYHTVARQVLGDNQELNKSFRDMSQTPQVRWAEFTNQLRGLILTIGTGALPVFVQMAKPLERFVHWFDSLSASTKRNIVQFSAWLAIGLLVGGTVLVVVGAFGRMYAAMRLLLIGRAGVAALEGGFITAATALRAGLIGALILAIPLLIRYHTQVGHVVNALGGMKTILGLIITMTSAWQIAKIIRGIAGIGTAAIVADGEVATLRASLLGLSTMSIAVPIVLTVVGSAALIKMMHWAGKGIPNAVRGRHDSAPMPGDPHKWSTNVLEAMTMGGPNTPYYKKHPGLYDQYYRILSQRRQGANTSGMSNDPMHDVRSGRPTLTQARANLPRSSGGGTFDLNSAIANVEKLRRAAEKAPSFANYNAYEKALSALQSHYTGDQLTALNDYLNAIESSEKKSNSKRLTAAQKAAKARAKAEKDSQKEVLKAAKVLQDQYQSAYQNNQQAFGTLFQGPFVNSPMEQNRLQYGGRLTGRDLLHDLRSQVTQFKQWRGLLAQLRKRGITGDLYDQIVAAGPGSIDEVKALLALSKADLRSYAKTFQASENLIAGATKQDMSISLLRYRHYGRNIALQIIQGLRDEHTPLLKVFEDMIIKDFPGLAKRAGKGPNHNTPTPKPPHTTTAHHPTRTTQSATVENHTHYHVTAPRTEHSSINTQLRHAAFASKTKHLKKPLP